MNGQLAYYQIWPACPWDMALVFSVTCSLLYAFLVGCPVQLAYSTGTFMPNGFLLLKETQHVQIRMQHPMYLTP